MAADVKTLSFEQAVEELEQIVSALERGDVALDRSIEIYERGEALKKHCEALLKAAEDRIEKIRLDRAGKAAARNRSTGRDGGASTSRRRHGRLGPMLKHEIIAKLLEHRSETRSPWRRARCAVRVRRARDGTG